MEFCRVSMEAHRHAATLYVAGFLATFAASRAEELMTTLSKETSVVRVDLRAVDLIDPDSFVRVARALNGWRDRSHGRVLIEFPKRSLRPRQATRAAFPADIFRATAASGATV